jgi:hypothetical protein
MPPVLGTRAWLRIALRKRRNGWTPSHYPHRAMDRKMILEHLAQARRHVADGERHLAHEREIIAEKERDGHDTATSKQLLDQFKQIYTMYVAERDRLEEELVEASE